MTPLPSRTEPASASAAGFRLRNARRGDVESLSALIIELGFAEGCDASIVHWVLSHPETEVIVAVDAMDKPIGMVALSHRPQLRLKGRRATIDELVVLPHWRKKGVGRALLQRAIERAKALAVKKLILTAELDHADGPGFSQKLGFSETGAHVLRLDIIPASAPTRTQ
ncbi:MAG: GNAT family N-acetyltransferase [Myxococcaceae bacterium]